MSYGEYKEYCCGYCGFKFKAHARATGGGTDDLGRNINCVSNKIMCPNCSNMVKTWNDKSERNYCRIAKKNEK